MKEAKRTFLFSRYKLSQFTTQDFKIPVSTLAVQVHLSCVFKKKNSGGAKVSGSTKVTNNPRLKLEKHSPMSSKTHQAEKSRT
jgi:hypothetical protein